MKFPFRQALAIVLMFSVALTAGILTGLSLQKRFDAPPPPPPPSPLWPSLPSASQGAPGGGGREGWLTRELELRPEQQKAISQIWSQMNRQAGPDDRERRRGWQREKDQAIQSLIPPDRLAEFQAIEAKYAQLISEQDAMRRAAFDQAVAKTKEVLDPAQREKYEQWLARRNEMRSKERRPAPAPQ